jgi:hypothetical protein
VPIDVAFRGPAGDALTAPSLGAHNKDYFGGREPSR